MNKLTTLAMLLTLVAGLNGIARADGGSTTNGPHTNAPTLPPILLVLSGVLS